MAAEHFDLKPARQCMDTNEGHFGELYKEIHQDQSGLVARQQIWNPQQWSALEMDMMGRDSRYGGGDPGPYNKHVIDMVFGSDVYSLGQDTKNLTINGKPIENGSPQYKDAVAKMETAEKSINFNAPYCADGPRGAFYENLDQKASD